MSGHPAPVAYRKAIRAASLPWNQQSDHRLRAGARVSGLPARDNRTNLG